MKAVLLIEISGDGQEWTRGGTLSPVDILPALKDRDSSCAAHAALRWVPASAPVARTSPGLTSAPQAF